MDIKITEMTIADYDEVFALWESTEGMGLHPEDVDSRNGIARYLDRCPGLSFVARDEAKLVGAVLCGTDGRKGYLSHLVVCPGHRKRGIGTALVDRSLTALKDMGIRKCNLFALAQNESGLEFWKKGGWRCYAEFGVKVMQLQIE